MVPGKYNIEIYRGGTYSTGITAKTRENGVSVVFDGYTSMRMQIRPPWSYTLGAVRPAPLLELSTVNGGLSITPNGLGIVITIAASVTAALPFSEGVYDLELIIEEAGKEDVVDKLLFGSVKVMDEVTV